MSSPSPHQDSPKVPKGGWPSVLHVVEIGPGSTPPSFRASADDHWLPELAKQTYVLASALEEAEDRFEFCDNCERPSREEDLKVVWCKDAESGEPVDARICLVCRLEAERDAQEWFVARDVCIICRGPLEGAPGPECDPTGCPSRDGSDA